MGVTGVQTCALPISAEPAVRMGITLDPRPANTLVDVELAVRALAADGADALLILSSPLFSANTAAIAAMANATRLPAVLPLPHFSRDGGLVAYRPHLPDLLRPARAHGRRIEIRKGAGTG